MLKMWLRALAVVNVCLFVTAMDGNSESAKPLANDAGNKTGGPVILELFTSEGCSSCPPADDLLSQTMQKHPATVAGLSEHVDYWNNLGWTDPNSSGLYTTRQRDYADRLRLNSVYTPQLVVNGIAQCVGNDPRLVNEIVQEALAHPPQKINLEPVYDSARCEISVSLKLQPDWDPTDSIYLFIAENGASSKVSAGENGGKTLKHDGVARLMHESKIAKERSSAVNAEMIISLSCKTALNPSKISVIAFVQKPKQGKIIASGKAALLLHQAH